MPSNGNNEFYTHAKIGQDDALFDLSLKPRLNAPFLACAFTGTDVNLEVNYYIVTAPSLITILVNFKSIIVEKLL